MEMSQMGFCFFSTLWCLAPVGTMITYGFKAGGRALPWSFGMSKDVKGGRAVVFSRHVVGLISSMWDVRVIGSSERSKSKTLRRRLRSDVLLRRLVSRRAWSRKGKGGVQADGWEYVLLQYPN